MFLELKEATLKLLFLALLAPRDGNVGQLVHRFHPDWNISTSMRCVGFCTDIHVPERMNDHIFVFFSAIS